MGLVQLNSVTKAQRMQRQSPSFANSLCVLCVFMTFPLPQLCHIVKRRMADHNGPPSENDLLTDAKLLDQAPILGDILFL
jgi:hypothetical protein